MSILDKNILDIREIKKSEVGSHLRLVYNSKSRKLNCSLVSVSFMKFYFQSEELPLVNYH